jgi:hypothetical protein
MDYCGPGRLPRSEFLGWAKDDRDAALLWVLRNRERCAGCGTHPDEWDPDKGGHPQAFLAALHHCPGCAALEVRNKRADTERQKGEIGAGVHVVLRRPKPKEPR